MKIRLIPSPNNWKKFKDLQRGDWFITNTDPVQGILSVHLKTENFRIAQTADSPLTNAVDMDGTFKMFAPDRDVCLLEDVSLTANYTP